jgi:hypothetical protein
MFKKALVVLSVIAILVFTSVSVQASVTGFIGSKTIASSSSDMNNKSFFTQSGDTPSLVFTTVGMAKFTTGSGTHTINLMLAKWIKATNQFQPIWISADIVYPNPGDYAPSATANVYAEAGSYMVGACARGSNISNIYQQGTGGSGRWTLLSGGPLAVGSIYTFSSNSSGLLVTMAADYFTTDIKNISGVTRKNTKLINGANATAIQIKNVSSKVW